MQDVEKIKIFEFMVLTTKFTGGIDNYSSAYVMKPANVKPTYVTVLRKHKIRAIPQETTLCNFPY